MKPASRAWTSPELVAALRRQIWELQRQVAQIPELEQMGRFWKKEAERRAEMYERELAIARRLADELHDAYQRLDAKTVSDEERARLLGWLCGWVGPRGGKPRRNSGRNSSVFRAGA